MAKNLGDILLEQGIIDRPALEKALALQKRRLGEILIEERLADPVAIANALKFQARTTDKRRTTVLDIEVSALDSLLSRLEFLEDELRQVTAVSPSSIVTVHSIREVLEGMLLEPIKRLFDRARIVADHTAKQLGISVVFQAVGETLIVDKALTEDLSDLILHLVRNSLAHGIESAEERKALGKNPEGTLKFSVQVQSGKLIIRIEDDGRGIDENKVFERATKLGLCKKPKAELSQQEIYQFLFTPGFSTAEEVSEVSGRGVGLDVVEAGALRLGGEVHAESQAGKGAAFTISVPVSHARLPIVPLRVGKYWVAVQASEILKIEKADTQRLLSAASLFEEKIETQEPTFAVTSRSGICWAFHEAGAPEDALIHGSSSFAQGSHGVVGSARLADGRHILLVDLELLSGIADPISN